MEKRNTFFLKLTGFLEMIVGTIAIIMTCSVLAQEKMHVTIGSFIVDKTSTLSLILIVMIAILQILAGILALAYAEDQHKVDFCFILGMVLLFAQVLTLNKTDRTLAALIIDLISIGIPSSYLYNATKCKK